MKITDNIAVAFHRFLQLPNLEKLQMVEAINEYFDSNNKESIREENVVLVERIQGANGSDKCISCGR